MVNDFMSCFIEFLEGVCVVGIIYCVVALIVYTVIDHIELRKWKKGEYDDRS